MLGKGSLLVSEHNRAHFIFSRTSMITVRSHAVITKDDQSGFIIHLVNNVVKDVLRVNDLSLNFRVMSAVSMASTINTDNVSKHQRELAAIIKLPINIFGNVVVKRVKVTDVKAFILLMAFEILAKHWRPDIVTVEDYIVSLTVSLLELVEHVVLFHFA